MNISQPLRSFAAIPVMAALFVAPHAQEILVQPGESIQAALDQAAAGAVIQLAPGRFAERVVLSKPVTLRGSGWQETELVLGLEDSSKASSQAAWNAMREVRDAPDEATRIKRYRTLVRTSSLKPPILIDGCEGVVLEHLEVRLEGRPPQGAVRRESAIIVLDASATLRHLAVTGSPGNGIEVSYGKNVTVTDSLVCAAWGTGVELTSNVSSNYLVSRSELRSNHHRCLTIGGGQGLVRVAENRISGSGWHGIRYDGASPIIERNLIFGSRRTGIYASGSTRAQVRGNVFDANPFTGWFDCQDRIVRNAFVGNGKQLLGRGQVGVSIIGQSNPTIEDNLFAYMETAIEVSKTKGEMGEPKGRVEARDNRFFKNGSQLEKHELGLDLKLDEPGANNREVELPAPNDHASLVAQALASTLVHTMPPIESVWPEQPGESACLVASKLRSGTIEASAEVPVQPDSTEHLIQKILDDETRAAAIETIRADLASEDKKRQATGLAALSTTYQLEFDRSSFRAPVLALTETQSGWNLRSALYALNMIGLEEGDGDLLLKVLARDKSSEVQESASHLLQLYFKGEVLGDADKHVNWLLDEADKIEDVNLRREVFRGLWGARITPELETRLLGYAKPDSPSRNDAHYYALSTLPKKSRATVEYLLSTLVDPDPNIHGRALWGLSYGISADELPLLEEWSKKSALRHHVREELAKVVERLGR